MEYSIVHSDLANSEIKPQELLKTYSQYLESDIKELFDSKKFIDYRCPNNGESKTREKFNKMGMTYCISTTFGNAYLSPRPDKKQLVDFYHKSKAREFWLKGLWSTTIQTRKQKIIRPQLEWAKTFIEQYLSEQTISIAEYYPNQWGYFEEVRNMEWLCDYCMVKPLFSSNLCESIHLDDCMRDDKDFNQKFNVVCLFEALDRSEDPAATLQWAVGHLKPGGLCFITCLLASGFEIQVLGQESNAFMPPERMNLFSYEGLVNLIEKFSQFKILEFSTPGVLDIPNIRYAMQHQNIEVPRFVRYMIETRKDPNLLLALQDFLQMNKLSSFGRLVLRKNHEE